MLNINIKKECSTAYEYVVEMVDGYLCDWHTEEYISIIDNSINEK